MSTRAPSLGRGCRAQRGGVGFLFLRRSRLLFAFPTRGRLCPSILFFFTYAYIRFDDVRKAVSPYRSLPHWGRGTAQRRSGAFVNGVLETIFPALFHFARTLSGSLRSPPSPRGEGFVSGIAVSPYRSLVFSSLRVRMHPHRLSISPRNPRA